MLGEVKTVGAGLAKAAEVRSIGLDISAWLGKLIDGLIDGLRAAAMARRISATQARVSFGELMRRVVSDDEPVVVERAGSPQVVVISNSRYEALLSSAAQAPGLAALDRAEALARRIRLRRATPLPPAEEVLQEVREERDGELGLR